MAQVHLELVGTVQFSKLLGQVARNLKHRQERQRLTSLASDLVLGSYSTAVSGGEPSHLQWVYKGSTVSLWVYNESHLLLLNTDLHNYDSRKRDFIMKQTSVI